MNVQESGVELAIRLAVHEASHGLSGAKYLAEEVLEDLERVVRGHRESLTDQEHWQSMLDRLALVIGYLDLNEISLENLRATYAPAAVARESSEYFQPEAVLEDAVRLMRHVAVHQRAVRLRTQIRPVGTVFGSRPAFRRLVFNVLDNAIKYSFRGDGESAHRFVDVDLSPWKDGGRLRVVNYGTGILSSELTAVWDPEVRGALALADRKLGMGLGLAEVQRAATILEGEVSIECEPLARECSTMEALELLAARDLAAARNIPCRTTVSFRFTTVR